MVTCPQCGRENAANSKFCVHCGAAIPVQSATPPPQQAGGYPQQGYQAPYRAERVPFAGDLRDHPTFVIALVLALSTAVGMTLQNHLMGSPFGAFVNSVVIFLFQVIFL